MFGSYEDHDQGPKKWYCPLCSHMILRESTPGMVECQKCNKRSMFGRQPRLHSSDYRLTQDDKDFLRTQGIEPWLE